MAPLARTPSELMFAHKILFLKSLNKLFEGLFNKTINGVVQFTCSYVLAEPVQYWYIYSIILSNGFF